MLLNSLRFQYSCIMYGQCPACCLVVLITNPILTWTAALSCWPGIDVFSFWKRKESMKHWMKSDRLSRFQGRQRPWENLWYYSSLVINYSMLTLSLFIFIIINTRFFCNHKNWSLHFLSHFSRSLSLPLLFLFLLLLLLPSQFSSLFFLFFFLFLVFMFFNY